MNPVSCLGIDAGTHESGYAVYVKNGGVLAKGVLPNREILDVIRKTDADILAIEKIVNYGVAVGQEVFDTCVFMGRCQQAWNDPAAVVFVPRLSVKKFLCGTGKAKDPQVRGALIARLGPSGSKAKPGPTYGVTSHAWSALAVAVTALHA